MRKKKYQLNIQIDKKLKYIPIITSIISNNGAIFKKWKDIYLFFLKNRWITKPLKRVCLIDIQSAQKHFKNVKEDFIYDGFYTDSSIYICINPYYLQNEQLLTYFFIHELAHHMIETNKEVNKCVYNKARLLIIKKFLKGKKMSSEKQLTIGPCLPEEFVANAIATIIVGKSYNYEEK